MSTPGKQQVPQHTLEALALQAERIKGLEEQTPRKEDDVQETLAVEALTEYWQAAFQIQSTQIQMLEKQAQRKDADNRETLSILRLNRGLPKTRHILQDTREVLGRINPSRSLQIQQLHEGTLPKVIYSYNRWGDLLYWTNLVTGEQSSHQMPSYTFEMGCCWSEVPEGRLLITGGGYPSANRKVVKIHVGTFEVSHQQNMPTPRRCHAAVYHTQRHDQHLYVLGGNYRHNDMRECERYVCAENRWEVLPPLPRACSFTSGVVVESCLYALGGMDGVASYLDLVQRFDLERLTWKLMELKLPKADCSIPCFKLRTDVYLVVKKTIYYFTGLKVLPRKKLPESIINWCGASYYRRGTLYCSYDEGAARSYEIGSLSN
jgi:hypothetical protein